jgi:hypothetical protein
MFVHSVDVGTVNNYSCMILYYIIKCNHRKATDELISAGIYKHAIVVTNNRKTSQLVATLKLEMAYLCLEYNSERSYDTQEKGPVLLGTGPYLLYMLKIGISTMLLARRDRSDFFFA